MRADLRATVLSAVLLVATTGSALAGDLQIEPTRLALATRGSATMLTISNRGTSATRFEAKAFAWRQDVNGDERLEPAPHIVVYPTLFVVPPGGKRVIRIATTAAPAAREQAYRIMIEELPALRTARAAAAAAAATSIAVRTRMSIPLFIAPTRSRVHGEITAVARAGRLAFEVVNRGTVHVKISSVRVIGTRTDGGRVFDHQQPSWYVLAAGTRSYALALDPATCAQLAALTLQATTDRGVWQTELAMSPGGCQSVP